MVTVIIDHIGSVDTSPILEAPGETLESIQAGYHILRADPNHESRSGGAKGVLDVSPPRDLK
jgi:hypothetical protein